MSPSTIQTARCLADRAEIVGLELRRLADSLDRAVPGNATHAAILASDRLEAVYALERLRAGFAGLDAIEAYRGPITMARLQLHGASLDELGAGTARAWAAGWDEWALLVDPGNASSRAALAQVG